MVSFQSIGAKVKIAGLELSGEARNFAFIGNGTFKAKHRLRRLPRRRLRYRRQLHSGRRSSPSASTRSAIEWADIENHPEDFVLTLSASVTGIQGIGGLEFSGSIQGVRIQPSLLAEGKFPIIVIDAIGVSDQGQDVRRRDRRRADRRDPEARRELPASSATLDTTTPVVKRVFYLGIQGGFSMAGMGGFTIRLGLSELGPLQVFINVKTPTGVLLVPQIGLTINDFTAGVEFFKTLPSIEDPFALRNPEFGLADGPDRRPVAGLAAAAGRAAGEDASRPTRARTASSRRSPRR